MDSNHLRNTVFMVARIHNNCAFLLLFIKNLDNAYFRPVRMNVCLKGSYPFKGECCFHVNPSA